MLYSLFEEIWEKEEIPAEWKEGYLIKIPKKDELSRCDNFRGITLLSVPGKVLNRIILEGMKGEVDKTLREEQAGFRQDRSCTDQIAALRIIVEQSIEWNSHSHRQMQDKTTNLARISAQVGLKINKKKTKILILNTTCERPIMLEGEGLEEVESFRYLGSIVDTRGGTEADVKTRISKARAAFHILRNVWKSRVIGKTTKIRLFNTNVKSVLLYGAETWRMNKTTLKRIQTL